MAVEIITKSKAKYIVVETYSGTKTFAECVNTMIDCLLESEKEEGNR